MLAAELDGLLALRETNTISIPAIIASRLDQSQESFLILEAICTHRAGDRSFEDFGHSLANLHRVSRAEEFGWHRDNYVGATPQPNTHRSTGWLDFYGTQRLGYMLRLADQRGLASKELLSLGDRLLANLEKILPPDDEQPCLLHGDLWSGNFLFDDNSQPVLIDPAVFRGHREMELAMPLLFGGFQPRFFEAYNEALPMAPGWRERVEFYQLYHLLNHLLLFGSSYYESCLALMRRYA